VGARFAAGLAVAIIGLTGCTSKPHSRFWTAMDCNFDATIHGSGGVVPPEAALDSIQALSTRYDRLFTDYDPAGPLSVLRGRKGDTVTVGPEIATVLRQAILTDHHSDGTFDMGVHDMKRLWGIGASNPKVPSPDSIGVYLKRRFGSIPAPTDSLPVPLRILSDDRVVLLTDSLPIDLGGIAKGYSVDRLSRKLSELGYPVHLVQAGGEILSAGRKPSGDWKIGIKNPRQLDSVVGIVSLDSGRAVSTSGDYERFFFQDGVRYHHIFDPRTGSPARGGTISVTLLCPTSMTCDASSKPLFVLGPRRGRKLADSLGLEVFWIRESPQGLCSRQTDHWGHRLGSLTIPSCPTDW
jgi:FAD:protein FMN transferase